MPGPADSSLPRAPVGRTAGGPLGGEVPLAEIPCIAPGPAADSCADGSPRWERTHPHSVRIHEGNWCHGEALFLLLCNRTVPAVGRTRPGLLRTGRLAAVRGAPLHRDGGRLTAEVSLPRSPGSRLTGSAVAARLVGSSRPGTEPVSPASAGGFSRTRPPGKSKETSL